MAFLECNLTAAKCIALKDIRHIFRNMGLDWKQKRPWKIRVRICVHVRNLLFLENKKTKAKTMQYQPK